MVWSRTFKPPPFFFPLVVEPTESQVTVHEATAVLLLGQV